MTKQEALALFGGTVRQTAAALGISYQAVYQWDEVLSNRQENAVIGAAVKIGKWPELTERA